MTALPNTERLVLPRPPDTDASQAPAAEPLSFDALLPVLLRRWRLFLAVLGATVLASLAAAVLLPAQYSANTQLMVDPRPHGSGIRSDGRNIPAPDATLVETEVEVMTSPKILGGVYRRLHLARDPEFAPDRPVADPTEAGARKLGERVSVHREGLTYVVTVRARSREPAKAATIANALAAEYLEQSKAQRSRVAADQARTLMAELGPLGQQVIAADRAVAEFRAAHGIVSGGKEGEAGTVTDEQIAAIAAELGRADADSAAAQAAATAARTQARKAGPDSLSQVLNSGSLAELRTQRAQVLREQAQVSTVYGPDHPASKRINTQLSKLDREIGAAARRVVLGLENDARAAQARTATLRGQLAALSGRRSVEASAMVLANGLQRSADAKRSIFNDLSRDAQERAQEARVGDVRAWQVAPAERPVKPSFPRKSIFLLMGFIIGSACGAGAVAVAERRESGFRSADEVERELRLPFLASLPELPRPGSQPPAEVRGTLASWDYVVAKPASAFAESIRNIRAMLMADGGGKPTTICVTSPLTCDGKSVTAVALARVMAMSGDRVLLLDCDLRRSGLAALRRERSGRAPAKGVVEVLEGQADLRKAIVQDVVPGLTFLASGRPAFSPRDIFSGSRAQEVLSRLKTEYDFVILDAPPVLAVTDAWTIASLCDATLLVARYAKTPRAAVRAAVDRLRLRGARLHGVVLNRRPPVRRFGEAGYYDSIHAAYYRN